VREAQERERLHEQVAVEGEDGEAQPRRRVGDREPVAEDRLRLEGHVIQIPCSERLSHRAGLAVAVAVAVAIAEAAAVARGASVRRHHLRDKPAG